MKRRDAILTAGIVAVPIFSGAVLVAVGALDGFVAWAWERHHNELSWYVRPLFLLPFCFFAYRRSIAGIAATLLIFPTSLFWFPAPENPSPRVAEYLAWELQFLAEGSAVARVFLGVLVIAFFVALGAAFWKRSLLWGLGVLNAATLLKVIWSVTFGGEAGWASLVPALVTLAICDAALLYAARRMRKGPVSASERAAAITTDGSPER